MRFLLPFFVFTIILISFAAASGENLHLAAPQILSGVTGDMTTPGYWIAKHPAPDALIMNERQIAAFNQNSIKQGLIEDFREPPEIMPGNKISALLQAIGDDFKKHTYYNSKSETVDPAFITGFDRESAAISEKVAVRYGYIVRNTDQRLLPTADALYLQPGDFDFDQNQNSRLAIGEPVLVLARSRDHDWLFVKGRISQGWVRTDAVATMSRDFFLSRANTKRTLVVLSARADLFGDRKLTQHLTSVRMGSLLAFKQVHPDAWEVEIPTRNTDGTVAFSPAFLAKTDANTGFLPFTPRTIFRQAFRLLDAPYGWGDANEAQDCSRFIQMVYACVGITLPRNSSEQGKTANAIPGFTQDTPDNTKQALILEHATGGATLFLLPGHIMLYLGYSAGQPYVIHATWAYRDKTETGEDRVRLVAKVTISDLSLGTGSAKGSLLQRLSSARNLK
jgi:hypothetical protein